MGDEIRSDAWLAARALSTSVIIFGLAILVGCGFWWSDVQSDYGQAVSVGNYQGNWLCGYGVNLNTVNCTFFNPPPMPSLFTTLLIIGIFMLVFGFIELLRCYK